MKDEWQSLPPKIRQAAEQTIQEAAPPRSIEEVKAMLESIEKGSVRNSIRNCLTVFQNDPLLSGAIAKNLLTERVDIVDVYKRQASALLAPARPAFGSRRSFCRLILPMWW